MLIYFLSLQSCLQFSESRVENCCYYLNTFYIAQVFLKSLAGCKTRKGGQTGDSHVTRRGVSLCLSGWDLLTAHCLLGSHGPRDPNLREICVAFWKLIAMRNELVGGVGWGWKTRRKTRFCRNILFVRSFVRSFVMTVCKFILAT